jgi:glycosyltransferase involved in cell wall biosynthesis
MSETRPLVGIDATPLRTAHRMRGIGRYLGGILEALGDADPDWAARSAGLLLTDDQPPSFASARVWRTRRSAWRPQDLDPIIAMVADAMAIRTGRPRVWHHTDPIIPSSPLPSERTIVTVYDLIPLEVPAVMAAIRPHRRVAYRRYLRLIRRARGVIAISETTCHAVTRLLGVDRERIRVVPPSIAPAFAADVDGGRAPVDGDGCDLLFVGVPDPHKRPELAIDVAAELVRRGRTPELTMVGFHGPAARRRLEERTRAAGIDGRVRFVDRIDDAALAALYRRSTTLALSEVEGFGLPPVEAVLAGGRVVATPIDAYRETLGGLAVFAAGTTPSAVADAVEAAQDAPGALADTAGLAARYAPAAVAGALRRAYDDLGGR